VPALAEDQEPGMATDFRRAGLMLPALLRDRH
jgi:hypothetical protein